MSTLGYGMYGINVLNSNGETDSLPVCRLFTAIGGQSAGNPVYFNEALDEYGMAVQNQQGSGSNSANYSAIRTIASGLHEIDYNLGIQAGAGAGVVQVAIYIDKGIQWQASGIINYSNTGPYYQASSVRTPLTSGAVSNVSARFILFLEKDCYITAVPTTVSGTAGTVADVNYNTFSVRCISTENSGKTSWQT